MNKEELVKKAQETLSKYEYKLINDNNKKFILSCTPMGFEDDVCNEILRALNSIASKLSLDTSNLNSAFGTSDIDQLRDKFIEVFSQIFCIEDVIYGYEEF